MKAPAGKSIDVLGLAGVTTLAVAGTATVYSESFPLPEGDPSFATDVKFSSGGDIDVKIEMEQSHVEPATEGAEDDNFVVPITEGAAAKVVHSGITDSNLHSILYAPGGKNFARYKFTGQGTNADTTAVSVLRLNYIK